MLKKKVKQSIELQVVLGEKHVATLGHDGSTYYLVYHAAFVGCGLQPFNQDDLGGKPLEIERVYRNDRLWSAFAVRLPSPDRDDVLRFLEAHGLKMTDHPLLILGALGGVSVSKPWILRPAPPLDR